MSSFGRLANCILYRAVAVPPLSSLKSAITKLEDRRSEEYIKSIRHRMEDIPSDMQTIVQAIPVASSPTTTGPASQLDTFPLCNNMMCLL